MSAVKRLNSSSPPCTWTTDDFQTVFYFLRDIRAAMDDDKVLNECRTLLKGECEEASRRLSRIADAVGAFE